MATGWHLLLGGLPVAALSLALEPNLYQRISLQPAQISSLAYASLLGGALAYGLFFAAASRGGIVRLSALTLLTPVFAARCENSSRTLPLVLAADLLVTDVATGSPAALGFWSWAKLCSLSRY